ncbi:MULTISPECIES: DUF2312 domain-containing protein [Rhodomicrobium]|uniref:DUF2312 domain-containing protein n=1 Tax=Rhodomicrobium TaxID=1068 RepID=UPI000B4C0740|nr:MULTISPECIES: DUF2312 domain-containing protein [Rhodomicrobium]
MAISDVLEESAPDQSLAGSAKDHLRAFVERIERLEEEKAALSEDIREVYAEAKSSGFDVKAIRAIVRMRKQPDNERMEQEALLATYMHALGMIAGLDSQ